MGFLWSSSCRQPSCEESGVLKPWSQIVAYASYQFISKQKTEVLGVEQMLDSTGLTVKGFAMNFEHSFIFGDEIMEVQIRIFDGADLVFFINEIPE